MEATLDLPSDTLGGKTAIQFSLIYSLIVIMQHLFIVHKPNIYPENMRKRSPFSNIDKITFPIAPHRAGIVSPVQPRSR
jgi:hypothetical protein